MSTTQHVAQNTIAILVVIAGASTAFGGQIISQLTDPVDPCEGRVDILSAQIEQDGGLLTFQIETREPIPATMPAGEGLTFLWLVDADNDPGTGQPHQQVGTEFNVRAVISPEYGGGFVDVTGDLPGGGLGTVAIDGNTITITVGLAQIANPEQFHWACDACHWVDNVAVSANYETDVAVANTLPYTPPASVAISTPLLMLSPSGPATGQLELEIRDADGNILPVGDYHLAFQCTNEAIATVDDTGLVTVHAVQTQFDPAPIVDAWVDGIHADNNAIIRSTSTDLGVTHQMYSGQYVGFYLPPVIEDVELSQITVDRQVVEVTDRAYEAQWELMDAAPFDGNWHYFVLDVGDDPATVPCGISGNPVRLGWVFGQPVHNSCYIIHDPADPRPQWGVIFHEMGHNFTWRSWGFGQFCSASQTYGWTYSEALASMAGAWCWNRINRCSAGLDSANVAGIAESFPGIDPAGRQALHDYQAAGAHYNQITPDIIDDILWDMYDEYTEQAWYDLFSTFVPFDEPLPVTLDTDAKQATWVVAALSVSAGEDLRPRFISDYGFPIDDTAWPELYAAAQARIDARPWQPPTDGDVDCDRDVDLSDLAALLASYEQCEGDDAYLPAADFNRDGCVDLSDLAALLGNY